MPSCARSAGGMLPCVICAGSSARLSTPPSDSARVKSLVAVKNLPASSAPPRIRNEIMPPYGKPPASSPCAFRYLSTKVRACDDNERYARSLRGWLESPG